MSSTIPELKPYEPYRDNVIAQEDLLHRAFESNLKAIKDAQIKLKNRKEATIKEFKSRLTALPDNQTLGSAYSKVFDGMTKNIQAENEQVF